MRSFFLSLAIFLLSRRSKSVHVFSRYPPGSSVPAMGRSVEKLLGILEGGSVDVVLPGHNECLNARDATEAAERHLEMLHNSRRRLTKGVFSRARAAAVLAMNSRGVNMPDAARSWIIR